MHIAPAVDDLGLGVAADRAVEIGADDADLVLTDRLDQDVRQHGNRRLSLDHALDIPQLFLQHALFDLEFHNLLLLLLLSYL